MSTLATTGCLAAILLSAAIGIWLLCLRGHTSALLALGAVAAVTLGPALVLAQPFGPVESLHRSSLEGVGVMFLCVSLIALPLWRAYMTQLTHSDL